MGVIEFLVDGCRGVYVPKSFAQMYDYAQWGISDEDRDILLSGPDYEWYWETWESVLSSARYTKEGFEYYLWQDGDLFAWRGPINWEECQELNTFFGEDMYHEGDFYE